jgi:hypothetical protein
VASFLLGVLAALVAARPARAAEPFRLDRVAVVQFTAGSEGMLRRQSGVLHQDGRIAWRISSEVPRPANTPEWALGRILIMNTAWHSYRALDTTALQNFELTDGMVRFAIGDESFHCIAVNPLGYLANGRVINISTRARVAAGGDEVIAGFVIEGQPRTVLVRAVGPTLARFGVTGPTPDPFLSVKRNGQTLQFNDNWWTRPDAPEIRQASAMVGAFPLDENSRDAARLLVLPPGAYTVHVQTAAPEVPGGHVLVEVYGVPDETIVVE